MSLTNTMENDLLKLLFQNTAIANIGDAAGLQPSAAAGSWYVSLHTADPGEAGDQTTSEATYTGYARVAVARSSGGFTVTNNNVVNAAATTFPACTGGSNSLAYWGIGTASSGAGFLKFSGPLGTFLGPATATTADTITIPGLTGVAVSDRISFFANDIATLPGGIAEGTIYYVKTVSGNDITISATDGGATLDITSAGSAIAFEHSLLSVSTGITPAFAAGQLSLNVG